ncbi:unnamed protein product [Arabis nemorensis]|uniref:AB hydrolase-1 domain-containing protein n=1 Tax=Arabis nemorensis TaxID=586526 RepID=A0A565C8T2_9BRAS|nr:unnamed protein product [Arabis nemorensis]
MVNLVVALRSSMRIIVKSAGIVPYTVEIEPGTKIHFWLPKKTEDKPAVLLIHGFAGDVLTWAFQVRSLSKKYSVYIPDLLFFGESYTDKPDRSPEFQAECLVKAMRILGVDKFVVVRWRCGVQDCRVDRLIRDTILAKRSKKSFGDLMQIWFTHDCMGIVKAVVVSGSTPVMTDSNVNRFGFNSMSDLLLPKTAKGLQFLFSAALHKRIWLPSWP